MAKVVIFGVQEAARLACIYLRHDSIHEPVAYTVTSDYLPAERTLDGLPIVPFEAITQSHPPPSFQFHAPMSYRDHNRLRAGLFRRIKDLGYGLVSYVSSMATVFPDLTIGENSLILEGTVVSPGCVIGDNVMVQAGCVIAHHGRIGDHAFLAPAVSLAGSVSIEAYAFVGTGACVRDKIKIAEGAFIAMGSVVREDTERWKNYDGNPARLWPHPKA